MFYLITVMIVTMLKENKRSWSREASKAATAAYLVGMAAMLG
jgi:hypothetical protein